MRISTDKEGVDMALQLLHKAGVRHLVFSPGSRNAPLVLAAHSFSDFEIQIVVDERSAGFIALGIAIQQKKAVGLICTSGSAVVNYYPALVEAFYQRVPLIVLSADRPSERIDQQEGQSIRQKGVFANHIQASVDIPNSFESKSSRRAVFRQLSESIQLQNHSAGPIHWNFSLSEPLYTAEKSSEIDRSIELYKAESLSLSQRQWEGLSEEWNASKKVIILVGQMAMGERQIQLSQSLISFLERHTKAVLLFESLSNLNVENGIGAIDQWVETLNEVERVEMLPDLVISFGGETVSRKVKAWMKTNSELMHWHIDTVMPHPDIFEVLSSSLVIDPLAFFNSALDCLQSSSSNYSKRFRAQSESRVHLSKEFEASVAFSDFKAIGSLMRSLPANGHLFNGNSSPVRYIQLFPQRTDMVHLGNRGVSGIDGLSSTAVGYAINSKELTILITGDLAFFYDINAFWQETLPSNLKVCVINNGGGGIFRIIQGPSSTKYLEPHFEAKSKRTAQPVASMYSMEYFSASDDESLNKSIQEWLSSENTALLEVFTPSEINDKVLNDFFNFLRNKHA